MGIFNSGILGGLFGSSKQPPALPDYSALSEQEAAQNLDLARSTTQANRPNVFNPYGSRIWEQDPENPDQWNMTESLSPEWKTLMDQYTSQQGQIGDIGAGAIQRAGEAISSPFSIGAAPTYQGQSTPLPTYGEHRQKVTDAMLSRVNTDVSRDRDSIASNLIARGIPEGSEAFNREMERMDRQLTDARQQAEISAADLAGKEYQSAISGREMTNNELMDQYSTGLKTHQQGVADALTQRQVPLGEMGAFSSAAPSMPNFGSWGTMPNVPGPDLTGAAQNTYAGQMGQYNANVGQQNALMSGLFSLGSAALSDIRLKHNIKRHGSYHGHPTYEFSYIGSKKRHVGVMAQEVLQTRPDAVFEVDGYLAVNYGAL